MAPPLFRQCSLPGCCLQVQHGREVFSIGGLLAGRVPPASYQWGIVLPSPRCTAAAQAQQLLLAVLDLWLDKFDSIGQPAARKLSALALCVLLPAPLPGLLERLELIATHITSVWFEVKAGLRLIFK